MVAMMNNELAGVLYRSGDLKEVERLLRTAIDEYRRCLPAAMRKWPSARSISGPCC